MIIQGIGSQTALYALTRSQSVSQAVAQQSSTPQTAKNADVVKLSATGKALAASEQQRGVGWTLSNQERTINSVKEFPAWGAKYTEDFAYDDGYEKTGPLVDISNLPTIRYTYTGELVTDSNLAAFKAEAATARIGRIALYEAEKANGTSDAEILEKLFRYTDTQSDSYLSKLAWERAKPSDAMAAATQTITPAQQHLLDAAKSDRASAEKIAYGMAYTPSGIAWNISGQRGVGDGTGEFVRKLSTTGEIVGDDYIKKFNETAPGIDAQRQAIYDSETKKGTDPVEILSKMIDFTNRQSQDYLNATGWGWRGTTSPA